MNQFLQFVVLGLGTGAIYGLSATGLVLVYRGSGVLNFAHGAIGMVPAYLLFELTETREWPVLPALVTALLAGAAMGLVTHLLILRPLRHAAALTKLIATLGVLIFLQGAAIRFFGGDARLVEPLLGRGTFTFGGVAIPLDRLYLLGVAFALTLVLSVLYRRTTIGLATTAVSEDELGFAGLGRSPDLVAAINWAVGGFLAGLAGILLAPLVGLSPGILTLLVVPAMAAALVGGFSSFVVTFVAGLAIGVGQSVLTSYTTFSGIITTVPFVVVLGVIILRGRGLPVRGEVGARMPSVGAGILGFWRVTSALLVGVVTIWLVPADWLSFLSTSLIYAIVILSIVVVTGLCGQLSLAQYMLAGMAAWISASLVSVYDLPIGLSLLAGLVGTILLGIVVGLPALRTRGVNLAVITLALAVVIEGMVMQNGAITGGAVGTTVGELRLFGLSLSSIVHPQRYATLVFVVFAILILAIANLRRSQAGLQLVAVRSNEKAAASLGIGVAGVKLYAFAVAAGIAGLAGMLEAFRFTSVTYEAYSAYNSVAAVANAVIAGVGYVYGAIIGAIGAPFGVLYIPLEESPDITDLLVAFGGALLIIVLIVNPNGLASTHSIAALKTAINRRRRPERRTGLAERSDPPATGAVHRVPPAMLQVTDLSVRFGGVVAVDRVSIAVQPGEIHGVIGPNGSGKTTLIDAISGFVRTAGGDVVLGNESIKGCPPHQRAAKGLTRSFQTLELFEDLTIAENLRAGTPTGRAVFAAGLIWPLRLPLSPGAAAAVREFGLSTHLELKPEELSYGQRRLVAMARAAAATPSILLLDEPSSGLDEVRRAEFSDLLRRLVADWGMGVMLVEHDVDLVQSVCDRLTVLESGRIIASGTPADVLREPEVVAAYLGVQSAADLLENEHKASSS